MSFTFEASQRIGFIGMRFMQDLDGESTTDACVFGFVKPPHTPTPKHTNEPIRPRDDGSQQRITLRVHDSERRCITWANDIRRRKMFATDRTPNVETALWCLDAIHRVRIV